MSPAPTRTRALRPSTTRSSASSLSVSRWESEIGAIRTLINVGELGPGEERFPEDETYPASEYPLIADMIASGRPYFNSLDDENCHPGAAELLRRLGKSSDLGVPILVEGETWGEVWASKRVGEPPFRAEDVSFLEAIAGQFATAIARAELFSRVSRLAYEDSLTGLPNRRALDEGLERALLRAATGGAPVSILLCDLDHLKLINDTRGHEAGDQALRRVAEVLVAGAADRPGGFVARVSGDEFCVLLDGHRLAAAVEVGAAAVAALAAEPGGGLSISCGAAAATPRMTKPGDLLRAADTALYAAKRRGGGQVMSSGHGESQMGRRAVRDAVAVVDPIAAATELVVGELDGRLADAPVLDRLEAVASAYTEAADLAGWTVSASAAGRDVLVDLSLGDNRVRGFQGIRVGPGTDEYRLSEFPVTERLVAAGAGWFIVRRADEATDPRERQLLGELGFESVIGVAATDDEDVYLLELYGDRAGDQLEDLAIPLRLAAAAAIPPPTTERRRRRRRGKAVTRGSEIALAVARRLDAADGAATAVEATADELQRGFGCHVVHIVRLRGDRIEMWAEAGRGSTPSGWSQHREAGLIGRCLRDGEPVLAGDVRREPQFRGPEEAGEIRSELAVPLRARGEVRGAINLEHTAVDYFDRDDARRVQVIAAQLGAYLHAIELSERS